MEAFVEAQPAAVRRDGEIGGELAAGDLGFLAVGEVDAEQLVQLIHLAGRNGAGDVERIVACAELRRAAVLAQAQRLALAVGRGEVHARLQAIPGRRQEAALGLHVGHAPAIGREPGREVLAGRLGDEGFAAAGDVQGAHGAQLLVVPADKHELPAIAREAGEELEAVLVLAEAARSAVGQVLEVQMAQRRVDDAAAVRRHIDPAQLLHREFVRRHHLRHAQRLAHLAGVLHVEGDVRRGALEGVDPPQLAAGPDDDVLRVRRPGKGRIHAVDRPGFLQVALEVAPCGLLDAGLEILQEQRGLLALLVADAPHEGQVPAVRRGRRPHRAAGALHEGFDAAVAQVLAEDLEDLGVAVLVVFEALARRRVLGVVEVLAVRRQRRLAQVLLPVGLLVELQALGRRAAFGAVQPDLARPQRAGAGVVLARGDELAVRVPDRVVQQPVVLVGDRMRRAAVGIHHPDVVAAAGVALVGDLLAVRREAGLLFPGDRMGQCMSFATGDRQRVEIAQQVED